MESARVEYNRINEYLGSLVGPRESIGVPASSRRRRQRLAGSPGSDAQRKTTACFKAGLLFVDPSSWWVRPSVGES